MGRSVNARIVYGFYVDEESLWYEDHYEPLPWADDLDDWWMRINDFVSEAPYPYTEEGEVKDGFTEHDQTRYFAARRQWREGNPTPWDQEWFGSTYSGSTDFFAVKGAPKAGASWGAEPFDPGSLVLDWKTKRAATELQDLMSKHGVPMTEMGWYLLAYEA